LFAHVSGTWIPVAFVFQHIIMNITTKLRDLVDVTNCGSVNSLYFIEDFVLASQVELLKL
jgi:hypothetical protein